ncbi:hypothetical protein PACTADRAFT_48873 [Pachysolen tannophilus NRRL Y-2460]|uniref:DH domain-containing protein n=1 Tax=Pachysolen tannophilus NRRL Y-2460 TaxID=669874 RepID=A0A1E4TZF5_PACTA|nr:hypothetical protein PACTADRAFT_48873 [Pachysolen tannophilus NRRL Y-2460]
MSYNYGNKRYSYENGINGGNDQEDDLNLAQWIPMNSNGGNGFDDDDDGPHFGKAPVYSNGNIVPPELPERPPRELIHRKSQNVIEFLSLKDDDNNNNNSTDSINNVFNWRSGSSSLRGPRRLPKDSDTNNYYMNSNYSTPTQIPITKKNEYNQKFNNSFFNDKRNSDYPQNINTDINSYEYQQSEYKRQLEHDQLLSVYGNDDDYYFDSNNKLNKDKSLPVLPIPIENNNNSNTTPPIIINAERELPPPPPPREYYSTSPNSKIKTSPNKNSLWYNSAPTANYNMNDTDNNANANFKAISQPLLVDQPVFRNSFESKSTPSIVPHTLNTSTTTITPNNSIAVSNNNRYQNQALAVPPSSREATYQPSQTHNLNLPNIPPLTPKIKKNLPAIISTNRSPNNNSHSKSFSKESIYDATVPDASLSVVTPSTAPPTPSRSKNIPSKLNTTSIIQQAQRQQQNLDEVGDSYGIIGKTSSPITATSTRSSWSSPSRLYHKLSTPKRQLHSWKHSSSGKMEMLNSDDNDIVDNGKKMRMGWESSDNDEDFDFLDHYDNDNDKSDESDNNDTEIDAKFNRLSISSALDKDDPLPPLPIDLPSLPFSSSSLSSSHFESISNIAFLSEIRTWCSFLFTHWSLNAQVSIIELKRSLTLLITYYLPRLPSGIVESNVENIVNELFKNNCIYEQSSNDGFQIINFNYNSCTIGGILTELSPCYSLANHRFNSDYRCYSKTCYHEDPGRNYHANKDPSVLSRGKTISSSTTTYPSSNGSDSSASSYLTHLDLGLDWVSHWRISDQELSALDIDVVKRQSHIFDLIKSEQRLIANGKVLIEVYGDSFMKQRPKLLPDIDKFYDDAFATVKPLVELHRQHLFEPLISKLNTQGKFLSNISALYLNWIDEVRIAYLKYAERMVSVRELITYETKLRKNSKFSEWLISVDNDPRVLTINVSHDRLFSTSFINHILSLPLTLQAVQDKTMQQDPDYVGLKKVIKAVKKLSSKIDEMQAYALKIKALKNIKHQIVWKSGLEIELNLNKEYRQLIKRGTVIRKRDLKDMWLNDSPVHLILLDNYLLLTEEVVKDSSNVKYKINEKPIPVEYLIIETKTSDTSVVRSSEAVTASHTSPLKRSTTESSLHNSANDTQEYYSFKIRQTSKHHSYTFYTKSLIERNEWLSVLSQVQSTLSRKLRKIEPYKLKIIADSAFSYDQNEMPHNLPIISEGNPMDLAIKEIEKQYPGELPRAQMVSRVLCSTNFRYLDNEYILVGLNFGIFMSDIDNPRNWTRILDLPKVTQIKVLEKFGIIIILNDKVLSYYYIDSLVARKQNIVGQKISKQNVCFFKVGQQQGSTLLFFMESRSSVSNFKVFIPIIDESTGKFEYFLGHKEFLVQGECSGISIFNSTFAVHTTKGFEIMSLSVLKPQFVPDVANTEFEENSYTFADSVNSLAKKTSSSSGAVSEQIKKKLNSSSIKPLGIFKLPNKSEFIIVYSELALFINNNGKISRNSYIPFQQKYNNALFDNNYLIMANDDIMEIWLISDIKTFDNRLAQVISGKNINIIDFENNKFVVAHPKHLGRQLILQLVKNDFIIQD